jgi:hypothetical protein
MNDLHVKILSKNKAGITMLLLFVFFLFQQSLASSTIVHRTLTEKPTLGACINLTERLSGSIEKNKHRVIHLESDVPFTFSHQLLQISRVGKQRITLGFQPLSSYLVSTQYTSTYL